jgi:hypothetical protein
MVWSMILKSSIRTAPSNIVEVVFQLATDVIETGIVFEIHLRQPGQSRA